MDTGSTNPHWRDLPTKPYHFTLRDLKLICVGGHWDPSTSKLSVEGLTDVSETDGKAFLASDRAHAFPRVLRVFRLDEEIEGMEAFFALSDLEGEKVLFLYRRRDLGA